MPDVRRCSNANFSALRCSIGSRKQVSLYSKCQNCPILPLPQRSRDAARSLPPLPPHPPRQAIAITFPTRISPLPPPTPPLPSPPVKPCFPRHSAPDSPPRPAPRLGTRPAYPPTPWGRCRSSPTPSGSRGWLAGPRRRTCRCHSPAGRREIA